MKTLYKSIFVFLLSAFLSAAYAAQCSNVSWVNPGDMTNLNKYKIYHGADQNSVSTFACDVLTVPSSTQDCTTCGILATADVGFFRVDTCYDDVTCAAGQVGPLPANPTVTPPAPVTGATANP